MATSDGITNGKLVIPITPSPSRVRMEIDELLADNEMTNLFLLAMEAMQVEDPKKKHDSEDWWTFYSIAGIHGEPLEDWNKSGDDDPQAKKNAWGYCKHGSVLFPTWHRMYVYMFEQAVTKHVQGIAKKFTDEKNQLLYQSAADRFRLPYWDPFLPRNNVDTKLLSYNGADAEVWGVPKILGAETVWVKCPEWPEGKDLEEIPNPLFRHKFPAKKVLLEKGRVEIKFPVNKDPLQESISKKGQLYTTRSHGPDGGSNIYGHDYEARVGLNLKIQRGGVFLMTALRNLLAPEVGGPDTWDAFATHYEYRKGTREPVLERGPDGKPILDRDGNTTKKGGVPSVSLESWHDKIHMLVGTGDKYYGHMADTSFAGFDPIFWLHHCNIDRILAIWQALYGMWVPSSGEENDSTPLYPFFKTQTTFWTSQDDEVKDWTRLGFAIPGDKPLTEDGIHKLKAYVYEYYSWGTGGSPHPPDSVTKNWPKTFDYSVALNGPDAKELEYKPKVVIEALTDSALVTRFLTPPSLTNLEVGVHEVSKTIVVRNSTKGTSPDASDVNADSKVITWNASIRVLKFAFDGSFNIHLFIGNFKEQQAARYFTKKNEIGFTAVFASRHDTPCANCVEQREEGAIYEDMIPITASLQSFLKSNKGSGLDQELRTLESLQPEDVKKFLEKNLTWAVTDAASRLIDGMDDITKSKLEILISSREYDQPTSSNPLGLYYPSTAYPEITAGKLGGYEYAGAGATVM